MGPEDKVCLVIVTPHNFLYAWTVRGFAKQLIEDWYAARERRRKGEEGDSPEARDFDDMLTNRGTFAWNAVDEDGTVYPMWAIGWEHVLGMYVRLPSNEDLISELNLKMLQKHYNDCVLGNKDPGYTTEDGK